MRGGIILALAAAAAWAPAPPAAGQTPSDQVAAYRISDAQLDRVQVDGWLTEDVWSRVPAAGGFRQQEPLEGEPASERTEVRIAYDDEALYIAIMAYDAEPDRVVARILQRDKLMEPDFFGGGLRFTGDDAVAVLLDPFHDHRNGVIFATNPNGAEFEALITDEGSEINIDWRGVWEVAGTRNEQGWSAEMAIPWRTLRYPDGAPERPWGINVHRVIRRKNEQVLWQSWQREGGGLRRVSQAGHLAGLVDLPRPGLNLEAKPYVLTGRRNERLEDTGLLEGSSQAEVGLDLKTEVRPGLVLDLTYNTDFAQVEVDDEQVNLTRFDLFFPEKRDFFLENSGIFEFGVPGNPFEPPPFVLFFSRRIGIDEDEGEIPILGGARLTGRVGGQTVGLLSMVTDRAYGLERESFSVARIKRDVGEANYVGAMVTDRRGGGEWNAGGGLDAQFVPANGWVVDAFYARTWTEGAGGDDHAYRLGVDYSGDAYGMFFNHISIGPEAESTTGFILRDDYRQSDLYTRKRWRPATLGLRKLDVWFGSRWATTMSGRFQDWVAGLTLQPEWESGDNLILFANGGETQVDESFELTDDVEVPVGRYRADHVGWFGNTATNRWVFLESVGMFSRFMGGTLQTVSGTLNMAPSPQVGLSLGYTRNAVSVPDGAFTADIGSLRVSYSFSTKLTTNVLVQYNSLDNAFTTNLRLNLIHRPGSDLFIVFTENRGSDDRLWRLSDRGLVLKVTYLARL